MYGTWGSVELMNLGDSKPRGVKQFNVACHPVAGKWMLEAFKDVPKWFYTTDTTRVSSIGFSDHEHMNRVVGSDSDLSKAIMDQYKVWYELAVKPRQEKNPNEMIFTHDFCVSLYDELDIYEWERVTATIDDDDDGGMYFQKSERSSLYASKTIIKPERYLQRLREVLAQKL